MDPRFHMEDPGLVPLSGEGDMGGEPLDMGGDPNVEDPAAEMAAMGPPSGMEEPAGPAGGDLVAMVEQNMSLLTPEEVAYLDAAIDGQMAAILTKLLGPEFGTFVGQFAAGDDMGSGDMGFEAEMGGGGGGAPATGAQPSPGQMPQHGNVGLDGGSVPGGVLSQIRA